MKSKEYEVIDRIISVSESAGENINLRHKAMLWFFNEVNTLNWARTLVVIACSGVISFGTITGEPHPVLGVILFLAYLLGRSAGYKSGMNSLKVFIKSAITALMVKQPDVGSGKNGDLHKQA